jgi:hypothetical protein
MNDSDSDEDCVPQISSNEESDDENDISDLDPGPSVEGFCEKHRQPSIPLFTGNPAVQFAVQNGTDMMEYVDNTSLQNSFQLLSTRQIYTHNNRSRQCHYLLLNMHVVNNGNL